jgi:hypothetical protein
MVGKIGSNMRLWEKLYRNGIKTKKDLDRAIVSLHRCKNMSKEEIENEEWALILNWNYNNGYI